MTKVHDGARSVVANTADLRRALGFGETKARVGPRHVHLHGYTREVTADIIGPSSRREAVESGGNVGGTVVAWEHGNSGEAKTTSGS